MALRPSANVARSARRYTSVLPDPVTPWSRNVSGRWAPTASTIRSRAPTWAGCRSRTGAAVGVSPSSPSARRSTSASHVSTSPLASRLLTVPLAAPVAESASAWSTSPEAERKSSSARCFSPLTCGASPSPLASASRTWRAVLTRARASCNSASMRRTWAASIRRNRFCGTVLRPSTSAILATGSGPFSCSARKILRPRGSSVQASGGAVACATRWLSTSVPLGSAALTASPQAHR